MLCQFNFKNFKSYKEDTVFDLQSENLNEFKNTLIIDKIDGKEFLPLSVIYGPNGGGKSNLLSALACLVSHVINPIALLKKDYTNNGFTLYSECVPFKFDDINKEEPTEFQIFFRTEKYEYRYNLVLFNENIIEEYLYRLEIGAKKPAMIFSRYDNKIELGEILSKVKASTSVNENMPYLSFLSITYNIEVIENVINWFSNIIMLNYANPHSEATNISLIKLDEMKQILINLLNNMDIDIVDYRVEELKSEDNFKKINVYTKHRIYNKEYELKFSEESQGTRKLFGLLPKILLALSRGSVIIIDELDAKLHPKLLRYVIDLFKNTKTNKNHAQLLFTSHDLTTMTKDVFRRDEIWFAAKNQNQSSEIYSLYDFKDENGKRIKPNVSFNKQYIEGRYGADPYLTEILNWEV